MEQKQITNPSGKGVYYINELEYVDGFILANIYLSSSIVKIDYETGKIVKEYDGSVIIRAEKEDRLLMSDQVLNGLAYDVTGTVMVVTGKDWGKFYQVDFLV